MESLESKKSKIINYIKNECGGSVEFGTLADLTLTVKDNELRMVALCKRTKDNPFGVKYVKYTLLDETADKIISIISKSSEERGRARA